MTLGVKKNRDDNQILTHPLILIDDLIDATNWNQVLLDEITSTNRNDLIGLTSWIIYYIIVLGTVGKNGALGLGAGSRPDQ